MRRRPFLAAASTATALAGCLSDDGTAGTDGTTSRTDDESTTSTVDESSDSAAEQGTTAAFRVKRVTPRTYAYALRLNDLGRVPGGNPTDIDDLADRQRDVVETAIDGAYETESVPSWLAAFADDTRYVTHDEEIYAFTFRLPTYTIMAEQTDADAVEGAVAGRDAYRSAVTHDGVVFSGLVRVAARDGVTFHHLWPDLKSFLEAYDAVEYRGDVYELSVEETDPGAPYTVTATPEPVDKLADGPVARTDEQPAAVREHLVAAAEMDGVYAFDDAPKGLFRVVREHRYAYHDGRFYASYVESDAPVPVDVVARASGYTDVAGEGLRPTIDVAIRNLGDATAGVSSGAPRPFGVLWYEPVDGDVSDENPTRGVLWSDAYEESGHVHVEDGEVTAVDAIGLVTEYGPGESDRERFVVRGDPDEGTYRVRDSVGVTIDGADQTLPYEIRFQVERT